jgi:uncharacterized Zn finger protein (UPF0148 family)
MITECPSCKKTISAGNPGVIVCPKCNAVIKIGDPLKDEESKVVKTADQIKKESGNNEEKTEKGAGFFDKIKESVEFDYEKQSKPKRKYTGLFKGTPWDNWKTIGFTEALYQTTVELTKRPTKFFTNMKYAVKPGLIPIYGLLAGFLATLFQTFWILKIFQGLYPDFESFSAAMSSLPAAGLSLLGSEDKLRLVFDAMYPDSATLLMQILIAPIMSIIITAFILHLGSVILGSKTRLNHFYRMSGFMMITGVLAVIPVFGNIAGFFWRAVLVFKGGRVVNNFSSQKAIGFTAFYIVIHLLFSFMGIL